MKPVNLYTLSRCCDISSFSRYERQLSHRSESISPKEREVKSLRCLVDLLISLGGNLTETIKTLQHFYFSFSIPKIAKEFDLLRISETLVIDIELKSISTEEVMIKQLKQNRYYLSTLCREMKLYAFVAETQTLYYLAEDEKLETCDMSDLAKNLMNQKNCTEVDIETLFRPSDYLISPLNTPERFQNGEYFLTSQQDEIEKAIIQACVCQKNRYFGITGAPGTGKTLLLYDLAVKLAKNGRCCIVHCGIMPEGLFKLNSILENIDIVSAKGINRLLEHTDYRYILFDESHRFHKKQFDDFIEDVAKKESKVIFSFDQNQILSHAEHKAQIAEHVQTLPDCKVYTLTKKIRTNKELSSFVDRLLNIHSHNIVSEYPSVSISYAHEMGEAVLIIQNYQQNGYVFINYTGSLYHPSNFDIFDSFGTGFNTHNVVGQEFEKVVMLIDRTFAYDEGGRLLGQYHPNPDYLYRQLLFQGLSRVREKLGIVILDNDDIFQKALDIVTPKSEYP